MGKSIHTVIFDLDGTLSDSVILSIAAFDKIAAVYGMPVPSKEAIRRATGYATPEFYYILFPGFPRNIVDEAGALVEKEEQRLLSSFADTLLFKGCRELLIRLKERGIFLNIASTGEKEHVFSILRETGIYDLFDSISCGRPDKAEMLFEMTLKGRKNGYLMVGDMKKDYEAARINGILSVGACYGYCLRDISEFDYYIDEPLDLLHIIKKMED